MRAARALAVFLALGGCDAPAQDACSGSDAKYYDDGLAFHLSRAKIPFTRTADSVCVEPMYSAQLEAAIDQLEKYFPQIAYLPRDRCEERALVEWGRRERMRYDLRPTSGDRDRPAENLFLIRSFTRDEMIESQGKLERFTAEDHRCKPDR